MVLWQRLAMRIVMSRAMKAAHHKLHHRRRLGICERDETLEALRIAPDERRELVGFAGEPQADVIQP